MHKRNITVGAILGAALLGSLIAFGSETMPRPKPVAPPPEVDPQLPVQRPVEPNLAGSTELQKAPTAPEPKDLPPIPSVPQYEMPIAPPLPTPKRAEVSADDNRNPNSNPITQIQHVEPKGLPLPLPPQPPVAPNLTDDIPPPPKVVVVPDPIKPDPSPAQAKPWSPGDTMPGVKPQFPGVVDIAPIPPGPARPPVAVPTSNPSDAPEGNPSHFKVKPRPPQAAPPVTEPVAPPIEQPPQQPTSPPPVQAAQAPHSIPYFQPIRSRVQPIPPKAPGQLKIHETSRPSGELHTPGVDPAMGASTPQLTVEKRGPLYHKVGGPLKYQIVVRNVGNVAAQQVRIEDEVPGSQLLAAQPVTTTQQGDRLVWILPALKPGEERTFMEDLQPLRPGDVVSVTSVHVYANTSFRTKLDGDVPLPPPGPSGPSLSPLPPTPGPTPAPGPILTPGPSLDPVLPLPPGPNAGATNPSPPLTPPVSAAQIPMTVEVKALPIVTVGQKLVFEVIVTNKGNVPLTGLMLYGKVPTGFAHPEGPNIGADLPDMLVGETKSFKMPMTAIAPGKYIVEIRVTAKPYYELVARPVVTVEGKGISIQQQSASPRLQAGKENEIKIVVANDQPTPVSQVHVVDVLPDGLEFVGASDRGMYQASSRTITWLLDVVPPGETRTISLKVQPKSAGTYPHEVTARSPEAPETKSTNVYQVESFSSLRVDILGRDGVMEQGRETVYAIRLTNGGNSTATNVQASVSLSAGLEPSGFAQAPTAYRVNGKDVVFAPIPRLQAGETRTIHLGVRAMAQGQQSVRVQVVSDQLRSPITREERTQVYREK